MPATKEETAGRLAVSMDRRVMTGSPSLPAIDNLPAYPGAL